MKTLRSLAYDTVFEKRKLNHKIIEIENLKIKFPVATPMFLQDENLPKTYLSKPLVSIEGKSVFGELAILKCLQKDGWEGVWVDTFHGHGKTKVFWSDMPPKNIGTIPKHAELLYDKIVEKNNGKSSGFFDVFAWKNNDFIFIEYKGNGDSSNQNELSWIESAIQTGIKPEQMFFVSF